MNTDMLDHVRRIEAERSFAEFFKQAWHTIEPAIPLIWNWHMDALCEHAQAVVEDKILRLLVNIPPGTSKSVAYSVMLNAWIWAREPHWRVIGASYKSDLSMRDASLTRQVIASEWYQKNWGHKVQILPNRDSQAYYENTNRGWRYSTSAKGALTGYRGDLVIVDDPLSAAQADSEADRRTSVRWLAETVPTRFNNPAKPRQIVIMQRLHESDHSGHILEYLKGDWEHLMLPMEFEPERACTTSLGFTDPRKEEGELLFPARFPKESVEDLKKQFRAESGEYAVAGQLQQRPVSREGGMFKHDDIRLIPSTDARLGSVTSMVRGWDFAASTGRRADWTVGVLLGRTHKLGYIVLDVVRFRAGPGEVERRLRMQAELDGHEVLQAIPKDPGAAGKSLTASRVNLLAGYPVKHSPETGSKELRVVPVAAQAEQHQLFIVSDAPWTRDFVAELTTFPGSKWDDQVDALSRAFMELTKMNQASVSSITPIEFYEDGTTNW